MCARPVYCIVVNGSICDLKPLLSVDNTRQLDLTKSLHQYAHTIEDQEQTAAYTVTSVF